MKIKFHTNYSPNFDKKKRAKKQVKFIIIHYTGMKSEKKALTRLTNIQSEVSTHYLITQNGKITLLVPELYIAWHAGKSKWKKDNSLNNKSIGIEISNPGHSFGYKKYSKKQINALVILIKYLVKKYKISKKNILGHSDIAPERKKDPGENFPWEYFSKKKLTIWHNIKQSKLKKLRRKNCTQLNKNKFLKYLFKIGYSKQCTKFAIIAFQRRFRPELIDGKIDQECLKISRSLV